MMALLSGIGGKAIGYGILALVIATVVGGFLLERTLDKAKIATLAASNATLEAANQANVAEVAKVKSDAAAAMAALHNAKATETARAVQKQTITKDIDHAKPTDNGPVAPVLRRTVDGLFGPPPAASGANSGGQAGSAGRPDGVPARAAAP